MDAFQLTLILVLPDAALALSPVGVAGAVGVGVPPLPPLPPVDVTVPDGDHALLRLESVGWLYLTCTSYWVPATKLRIVKVVEPEKAMRLDVQNVRPAGR